MSVEICNAALAKIGQTALISSLDDPSEAARCCKASFDLERDRLLAEFDWPFARRWAPLSLLTSSFPGWNGLYSLPTDCLAPRLISGATTDSPADQIPFSLVADGLVTDQPAPILVYTAKVVDPSAFSALFRSALTYRMAAELALSLARDDKKALTMGQYSIAEVSRAKAAAANEQRGRPRPEAPWIAARL